MIYAPQWTKDENDDETLSDGKRVKNYVLAHLSHTIFPSKIIVFHFLLFIH